MDNMEMLDRLISIKNNALARASRESKGNPVLRQEIKAYILQNGIEQLIIEVQNTLIVENKAVKAPEPIEYAFNRRSLRCS